MRRYFGWKKAIALGIGGTLALLKWQYLHSSTEGVSYHTVILVERLGALAIVCFGFQVFAPASILLRNAKQLSQSLRIARTLVVVCLAFSCLPPLCNVLSRPATSVASASYLFWSLLTIVSAWIPVTLLEIREWVTTSSWYRRFFMAGEGASAGMAGPRELRRRRLRRRFWSGTFGFTDGLVLGRTLIESTFKPFFIQLKGELGTVLIGSSRSGKSVKFLWPWLATNNQIKVLVDPKGHAWRLLAGRLSDPNYQADPTELAGLNPADITNAVERLKEGRSVAFDPYGLGRPYQSSNINVVLLIDPQSPYCRVILSAISQSLVIPSGDENHWSVDLSRLVLEGLLIHLRTTHPIAQQNLGYLADLFSGFDRNQDDIRPMDDYTRIEQLINEMMQNPAGDGLCMSAAQTFANLQGREIGIVIGEIARSLKSFTDPVIRAATSGQGFNLREIVESSTPITFFISMPFGSLVEHSRVLRVIISCMLRLSEQRENKSKVINFFLDEFAAYAKNLTAVRDASVTLGGAGVRLIIALQFIQQLRQALGAEAADAFEASSHIVASGIADQNTAEYLAKRFGNHKRTTYKGTWPFRSIERETESPILDASTILRLLDRKSRLGACIPGSGSPFLFETLTHLPLSIEGTPFSAWDLPKDAFDNHLLAAERGEATTTAPQHQNRPATPVAAPTPTLQLTTTPNHETTVVPTLRLNAPAPTLRITRRQ